MEKNTYITRLRPFEITHEMIALKAYFTWQQAGCPDGREQEFWFAAEDELRYDIECAFEQISTELDSIREVASEMSSEELQALGVL